MTPRADSCAATLTRLFVAARAPRRFLSGLQRQCSAITDWRRLATWLPELMAQRPQLLDAPLFGHALAAAVQGGKERAETPSPRTVAATPSMPAAPERQGQRSSSSNPAGPPKSAGPRLRAEAPGRRAQALVSLQATARDRAPLAGQSRTRVERSLLAAMAGDLPVARRALHPQARLTLPRPPTAGERTLPVGAESGRLVQLLTQRLRSNTLAGRAGHSVSRGTAPATAPVPAADLPAQWAFPPARQSISRNFLAALLHSVSRGAAPATAPVLAADLPAQWALPLTRQSVSRNFLAALLHASNTDAYGQQPGFDQQGHPAAANSAFNGTPSSKRLSSAQGRQPSAAIGVGHRVGPHSSSDDWRPPREATPLLSSQQREALATVGIDARENGHTSGAAGTGPGFPQPLFPAGQTDKVFDPTVAPLPLPAGEQTPGGQFFAALRRQHSSPEGFFDHPPAAVPGAATDDLEELTAKLQRILEEQARRHGIDV